MMGEILKYIILYSLARWLINFILSTHDSDAVKVGG